VRLSHEGFLWSHLTCGFRNSGFMLDTKGNSLAGDAAGFGSGRTYLVIFIIA